MAFVFAGLIFSVVCGVGYASFDASGQPGSQVSLLIATTSSVTPTNEWVNFYSSRSYLHGQPVPVGAVVRAYNPRGVLAGEFTVIQAGWYGVMPVYRDDPTTPEDEGLLPGEEVRFTIDGVTARPTGPDTPIWTANGELKQVNLVANALQPTNEWVGFYSFDSTLDGLPLPSGSVVRAFNPRGVLAGEYIVEHVGWYGVMAVYRDDPNTPADEGLRPGETVSFTVDGRPAAPQGPDAVTWTANGALLHVDLAAASVATLQLRAGWNLVALPFLPADPAPAAVLASIYPTYTLVNAYNACDLADPWKKFDPAGPAFANDLTAMDLQHGYWLKATQAALLSVSGSRPATTTITLCSGWNLIGYPSATPVPLPAALASIAGKYDLVYAYNAGDATNPWKKFDPAAPAFANDLTAMGPGMGYWLRMNQAATLVVGP